MKFKWEKEVPAGWRLVTMDMARIVLALREG